MRKIIILITFLLSIGLQAGPLPQSENGKRINKTEMEQIIKDWKVELDQLRKAHKGRIPMPAVRAWLSEEIYSFYEQGVISKSEMLQFNDHFNQLEKSSPNMSPDQLAKQLEGLINSSVEHIAQSSYQCTAEGNQCNNTGCCGGLTCAVVPARLIPEGKKQCKSDQNACSSDSECCSNSCRLTQANPDGSISGVCEPLKVCYKPVSINNSCATTPVCGEGECTQINAETNGIGECKKTGGSCNSNQDCCSLSCSNIGP